MIVNGSSRRMCIVRRLAGILSTLHPPTPPAFEQGDFPVFDQAVFLSVPQ